MSWGEARRLAATGFKELSFQAIHGLRQGFGLPPPKGQGLLTFAARRVTQSKAVVAGLLGLIALLPWAAFSPAAIFAFGRGLPIPVYSATVITTVLVLELTFLWWSGLQMIPPFLSSSFLPYLETLPIPRETVARSALLLYLRMFDLPLVSMLVLTPIAVALGRGSWLAGALVIPGVLAVAILALGLALSTGRFFVRHVQGAPGGRNPAALRWLLLLLWVAPAFAMYGFLTFASRLLGWLAQLLPEGLAGPVGLTFLSFPFPFALLPEFGVSGGAGLSVVPGLAVVTLLAVVGYGILVALAGRWLVTGVRALSRTVSDRTPSRSIRPVRLASGTPVLAVLRKDLRTASRSPGYAFVILLPLLNSVALGLATLVARVPSDTASSIAIGAVSSTAFLATFFGPAFFALELMGFAYTRSLPLATRSIILGKVTLVASLFLVSAVIVLGVSLLRSSALQLFVLFVPAELPAVIAAALLEFGILVRVSQRTGMPVPNLYAGAWWVTAVAIPGLFVVGLPLVPLFIPGWLPGGWAIASTALIALGELVVIAPLALRKTGSTVP